MSALRHIVIGRTTSALTGTALAAILFFQAVTAFAQDRCWTTAGSAGTVDQLDSGIVSLVSNKVGVKTSVTTGTVNIRYNVVAVDGVFGGGKNTKNLTVRFADNGANARVVVRLKQLNLSTGVVTTLVEFDSNAPGITPSATAQKREKGFNCDGPEFNFQENIFFIEAFLTKFGSGGIPSIDGIQICNGIC